MILLMGVAGSGKSTQGRMLADRLALPWLSTGEFLRMLIAGEKRIQMLQGKLLADQDVIAVVQKIFAVVDTSREFVLDGFPRTDRQADWLLDRVERTQLFITAVIHLTAPEEVVRQRLLARGRLDDQQSAINERLSEYERTIVPILDKFRAAGAAVRDVNGALSRLEVHEAVLATLRGLGCTPK